MRVTWIAAIAFAWTLGHGQEVERKVEGVLILSKDASLPSRLQKTFQIGTPFAEFVKLFANDKVIVEPWGSRSAILIDREIGPILTRARRKKTLQLLSKNVGQERVLDLAKLSEEDRSDILSCMGGVMVDPGASRSPAMLGVDLSTSFVIDDPSRSRLECRVPLRGPETDKRRQALIGRPFPEWIPKSQDDLARKLNMVLQEEMAVGVFKISVFGIAKHYVADGLVQAGKLLEALVRNLDAEQERAAKELAEKLGAARGLPNSLDGIANVPEAMRERLEDTFAKSYRAYGFESEAEALTYLRGTSGIQVSTNLSLMFCISPGGAGKAATFGVYQIASFAGTLPP